MARWAQRIKSVLVKLNRIITKSGDDGTTGLVSGERIAKTDLLMEAIGDVDELNASLGLARTEAMPSAYEALLAQIQNDLFDLGADIATPTPIKGALRLADGAITQIEQAAERLNERQPPLTSFILPAGSVAIARLHLARAIARRAERHVWGLVAKDRLSSLAPPRYLNRLSDLLFIMARGLALESGAEILWQPGKNQ